MLPAINRLLETAAAARITTEHMVLGDFNLHYSVWGRDGVPHADPESEELLDLISSFNLTSTLSPGTVTYEEGDAQTTIDLCWLSVGLLDRLITSQVDKELDYDSDHLPIKTIIDLRTKR